MKVAPRLTLVKPPEDRTTSVEKSISQKSARRRVLMAVALIGACALTNVRLPLRTFRQLAEQTEGVRTELFLARCRRLESILPAAGRIGYLSLEHEQSGGPSQYRILQYAFAPRLVERLSSVDGSLRDPSPPDIQTRDTARSASDVKLLSCFGETRLHYLVIVQAEDANAALRLAEERGWRVVADVGAGLLAFDAEGR